MGMISYPFSDSPYFQRLWVRLLPFLLLAFSFSIIPNGGSSLKAETEGLFVTQIAIDPTNSKTLYALTTYSIGVLKTTDQGKSWTQINRGIRSSPLYQLTIHPKDPNILYLGAGGAGLYKTTDRGDTWVEMNDGLQNTDIGTLVLLPNDPETIYIVTSTGLFKSPDGGRHWVALNQGDDFSSSQQFQSLIVLPSSPPTFYLASGKGLYTRTEGDAGWTPVGEPFTEKRISALAQDRRTGRLYAAVFRRGKTTETLHEGGLYMSDDQGKHWSRLGKGLEQDWVRVILIDPVNPQIIYLATSGRGILKSTDGGISWKEINVGLSDQNRDIRVLSMDPRNQKILYAGSHGQWIFQSLDSGATWTPVPIGRHQTAEQILAVLNHDDEVAQQKSQINPPAAFDKCNRCHGWTDPNINRSKGSWRVTSNRRHWEATVKRMSKGANLTLQEESQISEFLNSYKKEKRSASQKNSAMGQSVSPADEIRISVLKGKEEEDPVAAWDGKNFLVLWQTNRQDPDNYDVYGARISSKGEVLDPIGFPVSTAPSNQIFIDLAYGNGQYLAVWQDIRSRTRWEIYGTRIDRDGRVLDPEGIPIAVGERNSRHPQVAWDGENFFVVWMEENHGRGWDVAGVRLSPRGKVLDAERIMIAQAPGDQTHPALAWGEDQYWVVWMDQQPHTPSRISGTRMSPSGKVLDPGGLILSTSSSGDPSFPAAAWTNGFFVTIWTDQNTASLHTISGARVTSSGNSLDLKPFVVASSLNLITFPSLRCRADQCLLAWEEDRSEGRPMKGIEDIIRDVKGAFFDLSDTLVIRNEFIIVPRAIGNHFAKVAADDLEYLVVWKDYRAGTAASLGHLIMSPQ